MIAPAKNGTSHGTDELLLRVPEHSLEAERATLGAMTLDPQAIGSVLEILKAEDFYRPVHVTLYRTMEEIHKRGEPVDLVTLVAELRRRGTLEAVGGPTEVAELSNVVPTSANALFYAERVLAAARARRAVNATAEAQRVLCDTSLDLRERLEVAQRLVFAATQEDTRTVAPDLGALLRDTFEQLERRTRGERRGPAYGYGALDDLTGGLNPGDLVVIAGRPGMGKTSFGVNLVRNMADDRRFDRASYSVAFFSLEMPATAITLNLLCNVGRVDGFNARTGRLSEDEHGRLMDAAQAVERWRLHVEAPAFLDTLQLRSKARRLKATSGLDCVLVDYLQLMRSPSRWRSRQEEVAEISRDLKGLASELSVPVIALAQLNRNVEERTDHRPRMSDLRESGAIEADAAVVLLLHRDDYYMKRDVAEAEGKTNRAQLIVAKNRHGPVGEVELHFDPTSGVFADAAGGGVRA